MHTAAHRDDSGQEHSAHPIRWSTRFLKHHPETPWRVALAALATFGCALAVFHQVAVALIASGVVLASVAEFFFPLCYTLDARGARVTCGPVTWLEMAWSDVRCVHRAPGGIKLSPFHSKNALLEPLRGILLRCEPDAVPAVLNAINAFRAGAQGSL